MSNLTYGTLPVNPASGVYLTCPDCLEPYSAQRADYFMSEPDEEVRCECGSLMILARNLVTIVSVPPEIAET